MDAGRCSERVPYAVKALLLPWYYTTSSTYGPRQQELHQTAICTHLDVCLKENGNAIIRAACQHQACCCCEPGPPVGQAHWEQLRDIRHGSNEGATCQHLQTSRECYIQPNKSWPFWHCEGDGEQLRHIRDRRNARNEEATCQHLRSRQEQQPSRQ